MKKNDLTEKINVLKINIDNETSLLLLFIYFSLVQ